MNQRDRDVDQIVRTLENRQDQLVGKQLLSVETVYDAIKRSNSSLARKKKHLLYESIERVLVTRKAKKERELEGSSDDNSVSNLQQHDAKAQKEEVFYQAPPSSRKFSVSFGTVSHHSILVTARSTATD